MQFAEIAGFPNVIGAIDCTHIAIKAPSEGEYAYVNRKHFHSLNVQIICDAQMRLTNIVARWPGSTHDSFVVTNSSVGNRLEAGRVCDGWLIGKQFKTLWGGGELPDSGSAARLTHASPVGRNLSFYVDLYVRPLFFMSATVRLSAPTPLTDLATFSQASFWVLVLIPEEREPNKMLFLASTSEISTSTSHSLKFFLF